MSVTHEENTEPTVRKVHTMPLWWLLGGVAGLIATDRFVTLSAPGWLAGLAYLLVSNLLLARGLRRTGAARFGPANAMTSLRSTLVGVVTALVATSLTAPISVSLLIALLVPALALDAVDGWLARRTGTASELGARLDMEVDAFLIMVLSVYAVRSVGWWVLAIGLLRYAWVVACWLLPWLRRPLPPRYWRKVVAAFTGIALAVTASGLLPPWADVAACAAALVLLLESFGRDVVWCARHSRDPAVAVAPAQ